MKNILFKIWNYIKSHPFLIFSLLLLLIGNLICYKFNNRFLAFPTNFVTILLIIANFYKK